jgi:conjugative transfer region protein (TIGR03750 family)
MSTDPALQLPLAYRLSRKPNVILGLTWTECGYAVLLSGGTALAVGLVAATAAGNLMMALPVFLFLSVLLFIALGKFMQRYKHNRPEGYYQQRLYLMLQRIGFGNWYITESGYRDPRRIEYWAGTHHAPRRVNRCLRRKS